MPKIRKTVETKSLITKDGWRISITYYKSDQGKEAPIVLLLHRKSGNRLVWKNSFAKRLNDSGYAVITVDLRKHGQSKGLADNVPSKNNKKKKKKGGDATDLRSYDYKCMVACDMDAVKKFIFEEHQKQNLNMRKIAIIAPEMSAPIAINFALVDWMKKPYPDAATLAARTPRGQDVRALILLSPEENLPGVTTGKALLLLRAPAWGISFLTCYGTRDKLDKGQAKRIHQKLAALANNKRRMYLQPYKAKERGTDLLGRGIKVEQHMLAFLEKHLKQLPDQWRDRKSRL